MNLNNILWVYNTRKILPNAPVVENFFGMNLIGDGIITTATGNPVSIVTNKAQNAISTLLSYSPKQTGQGDPSPQNIRPIEGWTEANLFCNSGNFWDEVWEVGGIDSQTGQDVPQSDRIRSKNYMPIKGGLTYYVHTNRKTLGFRFYDGAKNYITYVTALDSVVSVPSTAIYFRFILLGTTEYGDDVSINYPSTDTEYHAYQGTTHTISLGGTYYGFEIDVERGVLRNEWGYIAEYDGEELPGRWISDRDVYSPNTSPTIGSEVAYELATPLELPLTPHTVALLAGHNTLWTDGDSLSITYRR